MSDDENHKLQTKLAEHAAATGAFAVITCRCGNVVACGPESEKASVSETAKFVATTMLAMDAVIDEIASTSGVPVAEIRESVIAIYTKGKIAGLRAERDLEFRGE